MPSVVVRGSIGSWFAVIYVNPLSRPTLSGLSVEFQNAPLRAVSVIFRHRHFFSLCRGHETVTKVFQRSLWSSCQERFAVPGPVGFAQVARGALSCYRFLGSLLARCPRCPCCLCTTCVPVVVGSWSQCRGNRFACAVCGLPCVNCCSVSSVGMGPRPPSVSSFPCLLSLALPRARNPSLYTAVLLLPLPEPTNTPSTS